MKRLATLSILLTLVVVGPGVRAGNAPPAPEKQQRLAAGEKVYQRACASCHQTNGEGMPESYPPLAKSDYLAADLNRAIRGLIKGQEGEMTVNGATFKSLMPPPMLSDDEIAQVLTYVLNHWGNPGGDVTPAQVKRLREGGK